MILSSLQLDYFWNHTKLSSAAMTVAEFLDGNHEDADFNQYWYSERTISRIVEALTENGGKIAFLSTPSLYFSIPEELKSKAHVFDVS